MAGTMQQWLETGRDNSILTQFYTLKLDERALIAGKSDVLINQSRASVIDFQDKREILNILLYSEKYLKTAVLHISCIRRTSDTHTLSGPLYGP